MESGGSVQALPTQLPELVCSGRLVAHRITVRTLNRLKHAVFNHSKHVGEQLYGRLQLCIIPSSKI